jgi:hypothetical protein
MRAHSNAYIDTRLTPAACVVLFALFNDSAAAQRPRETPPDILAVQLRSQGFACDKPKSAERDAELSRPDQAVWVLKCENVTYRMRLTPGMPAKVERLD